MAAETGANTPSLPPESTDINPADKVFRPKSAGFNRISLNALIEKIGHCPGTPDIETTLNAVSQYIGTQNGRSPESQQAEAVKRGIILTIDFSDIMPK